MLFYCPTFSSDTSELSRINNFFYQLFAKALTNKVLLETWVARLENSNRTNLFFRFEDLLNSLSNISYICLHFLSRTKQMLWLSSTCVPRPVQTSQWQRCLVPWSQQWENVDSTKANIQKLHTKKRDKLIFFFPPLKPLCEKFETLTMHTNKADSLMTE